MHAATASQLQLAPSLPAQRASRCRSRRPSTAASSSKPSAVRNTAAAQPQALPEAAAAEYEHCAALLQQCQAEHASRLRSQPGAERPLLAPAALGCLSAVAALPLLALPAAALGLHAEPQNALSLPTWAIHVSSVLEWTAAMALVWRYADASGEPRWKGLTWGMMPLLAGALCACTHHFFYNSPDLDVLVALQAGFTVLGNATCWLAAWRIYAASKTDNAGA